MCPHMCPSRKADDGMRVGQGPSTPGRARVLSLRCWSHVQGPLSPCGQPPPVPGLTAAATPGPGAACPGPQCPGHISVAPVPLQPPCRSRWGGPACQAPKPRHLSKLRGEQPLARTDTARPGSRAQRRALVLSSQAGAEHGLSPALSWGAVGAGPVPPRGADAIP